MAWARCYGCNPEHDLLLTASQAAAATAATAAAAELRSLVEAGFDLFLVVQFMSEGEAAAEQRQQSRGGGGGDVGKNKRRTAGTCNSLSRGPMGYACVRTYEYKYFIQYMPYICVYKIFMLLRVGRVSAGAC